MLHAHLAYGKERSGSASVALLAALVVLLVTSAPAQAAECPGAALEGWDGGDVSGWQGFAGTAISVVSSGGNPGGYLQLEKIGQVGTLSSQVPWFGDWASGGIRVIDVDVQAFEGDGITSTLFRVRRDASSNGWFYFDDTGIAADGQWHSFVAPLDPSWSDIEAEAAGWSGGGTWTFAETMSSVAYLIFLANGVNEGETVGIDNMEIACFLFNDGFETGDTDAWDSAPP